LTVNRRRGLPKLNFPSSGSDYRVATFDQLETDSMEPGHEKYILFVDDEPSIRATLPPILRRNGFHVTVAATVQEAISIMYAQQFDLLLTDLNIEREADGFHLVRSMHDANPRCITVILTGYPSIESAIEGIHQALDDYVVKPTDTDALIAMLSRRLAMKRERFR
jgi:DNA-binding NtrC family response regulator